MTNAEKFLKDGVSTEELFNNLKSYNDKIKGVTNYYTRDLNIKFLKGFLNQQTKPTLTENERVILRNIKGYTTIIRNTENNIQVENKDGSFACLCAFNHLFQFIKERRRVRDSRTIERRVKQ